MRPHATLSLLALGFLIVGGSAHGGEAKTGETPPPAPTTTSELPPPSAADIAKVTYEDVANDNDFVSPFARNFDNLKDSDERRKDWEAFSEKLDKWAPGKVPDHAERVRNLIAVAALMDVGEGQFEAEAPLLVYQRLLHEVPKEELVKILAAIVFHPEVGTIIATAPELDLNIGVGDGQVRERVQIYAKKMLGRVLGKLPMDQQ